MTMRAILTAGFAAILLTACNSSDDETAADDAATQPEPVLTPAPTATAAADGTALVPGSWDVGEDASGVRAVFADAGMQPSLTMTCARGTGSVIITLASSAAGPEAWRLDAGGEAARIDFAPSGGDAQEIAAQVDQGLAIIHALGTPGAAFKLTSPDGQPFQFPAHPGIRRVIDSCSQATSAPVPASAPIR